VWREPGRTWLAGGVVAAAVVAGAVALRWPRSTAYAVVVDRPPDELAPDGRLPAPLASLGPGVAVALRPACGGRRTELVVRVRDREPAVLAALSEWLAGESRRTAVRSALWETKRLAESAGVPARRPAPPGG
jgi:hypothetical protein